MLGVRIDDELERKLAKFAKLSGRSKSECAIEALREYLQRHETAEHHDALTRKGCRQLDRGEGIPAAEVFQLLDLWGRRSVG